MRLIFLLAPVLCLAQQPPDLRALVRDSLSFLEPSRNRTDDYTYTFRVDRKEFDSGGKLKKREQVAGRKEFEEGFAVYRVTEKNGKPLTATEQQEQEENIRKHLAEMKRQAQEKASKPRKQGDDEDAWLKEIPDALNYEYVGKEQIHGRPVHVITASPRPGFSAKSMKARVFEKTRARLWIDEQDRELVRAEAETFDTVNVGFGIIGRIEKGTRFTLLRRRVDPGAWLLESQTVRFGARVMLLKWIGNEIRTDLSDWRKTSERSPRPVAVH
jgi:hypothetical protein